MAAAAFFEPAPFRRNQPSVGGCGVRRSGIGPVGAENVTMHG
jgi:hypothetical protein